MADREPITPDGEPEPGPVTLSDAPDRILAGRAADGDLRAFEVLIRRHGGLMRAYANRVLGSNLEVDDVVQETFITAWKKLPELADLAAVKSWLMRIVNRKAIDRIRARHDDRPILEWEGEIPAEQGPEKQAEAQSQREHLKAALERLPEGQRQCWVMKEIGGFSYEEIAEELGVPPSTVRGLLARARKKLITEMEGWR
ncbi:RNA polymerase sigma factor [Herbiconiux liangxiaofengii]|uniref:RNA polymerase sigma factor n=1 Tax=Herbiconiux liangxiaofengii TaxID=3342795 RepID=UPI0035B6DD58